MRYLPSLSIVSAHVLGTLEERTGSDFLSHAQPLASRKDTRVLPSVAFLGGRAGKLVQGYGALGTVQRRRERSQEKAQSPGHDSGYVTFRQGKMTPLRNHAYRESHTTAAKQNTLRSSSTLTLFITQVDRNVG